MRSVRWSRRISGERPEARELSFWMRVVKIHLVILNCWEEVLLVALGLVLEVCIGSGEGSVRIWKGFLDLWRGI